MMSTTRVLRRSGQFSLKARPRMIQGVDAEFAEDQRQFVHQGDVEVALGVLDNLGRFGDADAAGAVGAGGDDLAVEDVDGSRGSGTDGAGGLPG